jgi:hypothetical protein
MLPISITRARGDAHGLLAAGDAGGQYHRVEQRILGGRLVPDVGLEVLEARRRHIEQVIEARRLRGGGQQAVGMRERERLEPRVAAFQHDARRPRARQARRHPSASRMPLT